MPAKPDAITAERKVRVIVIDPGHGGMDNGAAGSGINEKDLTLVLARKLRAALQTKLGATATVIWAGSPEDTAEAVRDASGGGVDAAVEATGRVEAMLTAFLSTRNRGAAVLIGIPREDAVLPLPALSIPRMERRVLGPLYGSSRPERDFVTILDLYRRGVLPLDKLISHRLGLDELDRGFELLRSGEALRVVLDLAPDGAGA